MFQGSALTQFYLLEDVSHGASAVPGTLQCIRSLLEQHDRARFGFCWAAVLLQGASAASGMEKTGEGDSPRGKIPCHAEEMAPQKGRRDWPAISRGAAQSWGLPAAVHAEEQTVKGGETWLGAFLGTGGVGG